ncbi:MAG: PAAR domain-containing protein [Polyangiaceae bacterium]
MGKLEPAARIDDPIEHSRTVAGTVVGALVGIGVVVVGWEAAATATVGAALLALWQGRTVISGFMSAGNWIGSLIKFSAGDIADGSPNCYVGLGPRRAARALDPVKCHSGQKIVTGCKTIFINTMNAARKTEKTSCDGEIKDGCATVLYGGDSVQVAPRRLSGEMPLGLFLVNELIGLTNPFSRLSATTSLGRTLEVADRLADWGDKAATNAQRIAEQTGHYEAADSIRSVLDNPAYKAAQQARGGIGTFNGVRGTPSSAIPGGGPSTPYQPTRHLFDDVQ